MIDDTKSVLNNGAADAALPLQALTLGASLWSRISNASLAWYCDVMGFAVARRYERDGALRAIALKAGAVEALIGEDDGAKAVDRQKGQGFSLQLTTGQNIDALANGIKARGELSSPIPWTRRGRACFVWPTPMASSG